MMFRVYVTGILLIIFICNGCSAVGNWLSGPSPNPSVSSAYGQTLSPIMLGVTTQAQVRKMFGPPSDIQTSVNKGIREEAWAYAKAAPSINPLQYLPFIGVFALASSQHTDAFSISFSSEGRVDGVSVRDVQPYGAGGTYGFRRPGSQAIESYGMNNPMVKISSR